MDTKSSIKWIYTKCNIPLLHFVLTLTLLSCYNRKKDVAIPQFYINTNTDNLNFSDYTKAKVKYINVEGLSEFDESTNIKYRGNSSAHYKKKCFSLEFSDKKCFDNIIC